MSSDEWFEAYYYISIWYYYYIISKFCLSSSDLIWLISIVSVEKIGDLLYRESFPLTLSLIPLIPKYSPNPNPTLTLTYPPSLEEWEY